MLLVEQHILNKGDPRFVSVDQAAFAAKNLYNAANYLVRQSFIFRGEYLNYYAVHAQIKAHEAYVALPRKVSQQVLRMLDKNWLALRMERLSTRRTRQINQYLHTHSRRIIDLLVREGIGVLVIGKNDGWKQEISIGKRNNQNFVQIPHARFIEMLTYKAELVGIEVILVNESHTSKCSFLDDEPICHHEHYLGKRITRGRVTCGRWQADRQCGCEWRVQHYPKSNPWSLRAGESGSGSAPGRDCPDKSSTQRGGCSS